MRFDQFLAKRYADECLVESEEIELAYIAGIHQGIKVASEVSKGHGFLKLAAELKRVPETEVQFDDTDKDCSNQQTH